MLGYSPAELENRHWQEITHPDDIAASFKAKLIGCFPAKRVGSGSIKGIFPKAEPRYFWADVSISLRRDEAAQPLYFMVEMIDITERKQAEALQQAIYQIAAATETTSSLDELFPKIHQSIASVMPAENFYIALYDEAKNLLYFPYLKESPWMR